MVNELLVAQAVELLGKHPRRILITGGTGFVGLNVAEILCAAGHDVLATGRNQYLRPVGARFQKVDIRDADSVSDLCRGQQVVIHCAAEASPWASADKLSDVNVGGTQNVIAGCLEHQVKRLVHVSSTAIQFDFRDALNIVEDTSSTKRPACGYAATKAAAEKLVLAARGQGLSAMILRARAVFGPGDNSLLPRLLRAYDEGKLRQIGNGKNLSDLTYIDNLVYALILAIDRGEAGSICTITGGQPVTLWSLLRQVLNATGRDKPLKTRPYWLVHRYAHLLEIQHRLTKKRGEPALTRYTVGLLAKSQTFSAVQSRQQLNYQPCVSMDKGIQTTISAMTRRCDSHAATHVELSLHTTGFTTHRYDLAQRGALRVPVRFHALIGVIHHSQHGITLFDTGYAPRFYDATRNWPYRLYAASTPVVTGQQHSAIAVLQRLGIGPSDVNRIIISHFHADHVCGLRDFPRADLIATRSAWNNVAGRKGLAALRRAFLPQLLPGDIKDRLCLIDHFHDPGIGPFDRSHDLFRDDSLRLIELSGHAIGQVGVLLQTGHRDRTFLVADATWTRVEVTDNLRPTTAFRLIADDVATARLTRQRLYQFHQQFPEVELIPTHCPDVARRQHFDASFISETP